MQHRTQLPYNYMLYYQYTQYQKVKCAHTIIHCTSVQLQWLVCLQSTTRRVPNDQAHTQHRLDFECIGHIVVCFYCPFCQTSQTIDAPAWWNKNWTMVETCTTFFVPKTIHSQHCCESVDWHPCVSARS